MAKTLPTPAAPAQDVTRGVLAIKPFRKLWNSMLFSSLGDWLGLLATTAMAAGDKPPTLTKRVVKKAATKKKAATSHAHYDHLTIERGGETIYAASVATQVKTSNSSGGIT